MVYEIVFLCETSDGTLTVFGLNVGIRNEGTYSDTPGTNSGLTKDTFQPEENNWYHDQSYTWC